MADGVQLGRTAAGRPRRQRVGAHRRRAGEHRQTWIRAGRPGEAQSRGSHSRTFKGEVHRKLPRVGTNHHAIIAGNFAEGFTDDLDVLDILELHDAAYNSWRLGASNNDW